MCKIALDNHSVNLHDQYSVHGISTKQYIKVMTSSSQIANPVIYSIVDTAMQYSSLICLSFPFLVDFVIYTDQFSHLQSCTAQKGILCDYWCVLCVSGRVPWLGGGAVLGCVSSTC